ncbi:uncharacterized protein LOC128255386 isoform X1 [Drosophila gunungcola]|uniref:Uncharacterized protein n=1 Tax=Drosophila gunungcola TaxID=103775 RepID=A0A9P9YII5_9MUSC|nr:uncharacterized protein LOC128255386 isoform X1 [Drosophila gunungcola]XP_052840920.1 uncharacterized protein LOC128255386 isoform X1 [Drosophila gunungcola]KAI8037395.1 hypothetical protein M5D96_009529 [Drosophila gunungcola]
MENLTLGGLLEFEGGKDESCSGRNSFDMYVNFLWIFVGIYVLSQLNKLSERLLGQRLLGLKQWCDVRSIKNEWELTLQLYEKDKRQMDAQVRELRQKNLNMERVINDLRDCNIHLISENFMRSVMQEQKPRPAQSNIYITNSHFHLTRQVFVNKSLDVHNAGRADPDSMDSMATGEGLNVWLQYLKMRKYYVGPIADPNLIAPSSPEHMLPIVMTTEQLARLQGMI